MLCKIVIICFVISHGAGNFVSRFEFEAAVGGPGTSWTPWRSGASQIGALHLRHGDRVVLKLCLTDSVTLQVGALRYSNDGPSDQLDISIDNRYLGTVNTDETMGGWGKFWNNQKLVRMNGNSVNLAPGDHALTIDVLAADYYGTELDSIDVSTNIYVDSKQLWCGAALVVREKKTDKQATYRPQTTIAGLSTTSSTNKPNSAVLSTASESIATSAKPTIPWTTQTVFSTPLTTKQSTVTTPAKPTASPRITLSNSTPLGSTKLPTSTAIHPTRVTTTTFKTASITATSLTTTTTSTAAKTTTSATIPTTAKIVTTYPTTKATTASTVKDATTHSTPSTLITSTPTTSLKTPKHSTTTTTTTTTTTHPTTTTTQYTTTTTQSTTTTTTPTTTTLPPETTTVWIFNFVKQNSVGARCVDTANVNVTFTPLSIRNVEIVARAGTTVSHATNAASVIGPDLCDRAIWDLGNSDTNYTSVSPPIGGSNKQDFGVNVSIANLQHGFPTVIFPKPAKYVNSKQTQSVNLRYNLKSELYSRARPGYFTLGLLNVTEDTKIGLEWVEFDRKRPSRVQYFTFTPDSTVMVWKIPPKAIKPKRRNTLRLVFDKNSADIVNIDFMRLDFAGSEYKFRQRVLAKLPKWNIRGWEYKKIKGIKIPDSGMGLEINDGQMMYSFAKVILLKRPRKKVLSIDSEGNIYPYHGLKISRKADTDVDDPLFTDVSGIRLRAVGIAVKNLYINTIDGIITIFYDDGVFVRISFDHSNDVTKLKILYTNLLVNDIYFFSTRYTDSLAAVNRLDVDGRDDIDILDPDITGVKGQWFTFKKTTRNPMFEASGDIQLFFPRENIQSQRKPGTEVEI